MENEKPPIEEKKAALISLEQVPATEAQLEQLRQEIEKDIEEKIAAFRADDSKIDAIAAQFNLQNQADVFAAKSEINFDHQLREINTEAENLKSEALTQLGAFHEGEAIAESDQPETDPAQEKYEKEILPMLQILKPDDVPLEAYEAEAMQELYEDVKRKQVAEGILVENPVDTIRQAKEMLKEKMKAAIAASEDYSLDEKDRPNRDSDFIRKSKIALLAQKDLSHLENYFGKDKFRDEKIDLERLGHYIGKNITKSELESLMKTRFADDILASHDSHFIYNRNEGISEPVLAALVATADSTASRHYVVESALKRAEKGEFSEDLMKALLESGQQRAVLGYVDKFKNVDAETIANSGIFDSYKNDTRSILRDLNAAPIEESTKAEIKEIGKKIFLEEGNFYELQDVFAGFGITDEEKHTPEFQEQALVGLKKFIATSYPHSIVWTLGYLDIPREKLAGPEMQEVATEGIGRMAHAIGNGNITTEEVCNLAEKFSVPYEVVREKMLLALPTISTRESPFSFDHVLKTFDIKEEELNSPEMQEKVFIEFKRRAKGLNFEHIEKIMTNFPSIREKYNGKNAHSIILDSAAEDIRAQDSLENKEIKLGRLKNIEDSFMVENEKEHLPPQIQESLEVFESKYGNKGKNLITLAVAAKGLGNPEALARELERIGNVLDRYDPTCIPDGAHVSMGIEYEATQSIVDEYDKESAFGYKKDSELISKAANIGRGLGGVHEFAPKPTYNPYMVMAEVRLMQEAGLFDLNFTKYENAPRGYHLSLGGDSGLRVDENMQFLNNTMTMAQLSGVEAGKNIRATKIIHQKQLDQFSDTRQGGVRCEIKGMATDSVEQFEKAILTAHHAGVAIQVSEKHLPNHVQFAEVPDSADAFEGMLITTGAIKDRFNSTKEKEIVFEWAKLKRGMMDAVSQHNASFVESEFSGGFVDKKGEYVDTGENIDIMRNKKLVSEEELASTDFKNSITISESALFEAQQPSFVNALARTNNIFLKGPQGTNNSSVNAKAVLDVMKHENYGGIMDGRPQDSLFDRGGEVRDGYYVVQGASEEMITHKSQILLNKFNREMERLLQQKEAVASENEYATAGEYAQE